MAPANRQVSQADAWAKMAKTYATVAATLRKRDWSDVLPVTDDFVVCAFDFDQEVLATAVRAAAGAARFAEWKKKKLV